MWIKFSKYQHYTLTSSMYIIFPTMKVYEFKRGAVQEWILKKRATDGFKFYEKLSD